MGKEKCKGLVGLHNFSGADWGGKFAGIGKLTWIKSYLALDGDDPIIKSFQTMGETQLSGDHNDIPMEFLPLEKFVCSVYSSSTKIQKLSELR